MRLNQFKVASLTLACILFFTSFGSAQNLKEERAIEVSLRMVGHQVLLSLGDSISRVLPITKEKDQYKIQFESEFEFTPEQLSSTIDLVVKKTKLFDSYIVGVEECESKELVYSFMVVDNLEKSDIIPCKERVQPKSCYNLLFTLLEINGEGKMLSEQPSKSNIAVEVIIYILSLLLILVTTVFFFIWKKKRKPVTDSNLISLGEYRFDKRNTELLIEHQAIELTSKESDLLLLLYNSVNTTVEREVILNEVWGDEGGYVGRTLDVFISKLRKKLKFDSKVKIVNVRGVGYKLIIDV